ncbi:MAG: glutamate-5-semialdehyde dehydrogenase [Myxococcales bacterium]|nr:glutamate-5-semialdehyde dehydrogenase [Myxococcales bacterium]
MTLDPQLVSETQALLARARVAARRLAIATTAEKTQFLAGVAQGVRDRTPDILSANLQDVARASERGRNAAFIDRLRLSASRLESLAGAVEEISALPDPVGATTSGTRRPSGIEVRKVRIPLGVIGIVYESRPNVTIDAGCLCIKAGNAVVLRGGSDASSSNAVFLDVLRTALTDAGLPADAAMAPATASHSGIEALVSQAGGLDVIIPRGGTRLIDAVNRWARVPVIQHYEGVCHIFVESSADLAEATAIAVNAKAQRPGVCNAMEALLVDAASAETMAPQLVAALRAANVEVRGCDRIQELCPEDVVPASAADRGREYLDLICLVQVVDGLEGALAHIANHGSGHTEAILTQDIRLASRFTQAVDASCVVVNASTRFNDGGCLGLGAEIGISTTKLHAYGPMGLEALTTQKYVVVGEGHVRN